MIDSFMPTATTLYHTIKLNVIGLVACTKGRANCGQIAALDIQFEFYSLRVCLCRVMSKGKWMSPQFDGFPWVIIYLFLRLFRNCALQTKRIDPDKIETYTCITN